MTSSRFTGTAVADGMATGVLYLADATVRAGASADEVAGAFAAVAANRRALASQLQSQGREQEADIVAVAALIAADPVLVGPAVDAVRAGTDAVTAVTEAAAAQAAVLAGLDSPELAERAGDIRQLARAVLEQLAGDKRQPPAGNFILVRREVAAADLIELADEGLAGVVSLAGGASSHAAIVARGLGVPMLTGVDPAVLTAGDGRPALLDCVAGRLTVEPSARELARIPMRTGTGPQVGTAVARTADGSQIVILCNVASAAETRRGLADGAAGVGLLRTEIPFTGATSWPSADQHERQLKPILSLLRGRPATVRLLDFSGDKVPPFLPRDRPGLAELLGHPTALADQLRVALTAGADTELAILIPMVSSQAEVTAVRDAIEAIIAELAVPAPRLGIMVELAATAAAAETFASQVEFFSIGTNDLTGQVLGLSRLDPSAGPGLAADARVLDLIRHVTDAAAAAKISVSVCGDSAADPRVLPLLVGLGVRAVSVPAASVSRVREWISQLNAGACAAITAKALTSSSAQENWELVHRAELS
ncbi:MAG TPA: putative PEP-binding protein [Streptosporangiaceae bacterium]|nr:putative PEP-binding protein [Streptosporangiaceae bacterium]